jgi:DNA mismatch repair protein MutL
MHDIIKLLPDAVANQIAAGEVVQRPASVVKELLENAIDAGSKNISLIVKDGGRTLIQVIDDGWGMSETDARMCFERHATSKILHADDLQHIRTMGFRGEAMASIAAVAQVELSTRRSEDELGTFIRIEGSSVKNLEPISHPQGTQTLVKNLFFNVPARRKFLKSNPVELHHIIDVFQQIALGNPEIGFKFFQNDMETYNLPPGKLHQRIAGLFGKRYAEQIAPVKEQTEYLSIQGYIGKPENNKRTRGEQFFFLNKRFIKNNYLHHALVSAYEGLLPADTFPFYAIFLEMDPGEIDINVHPTKTEVKFADERTAYALVHSAVRHALNTQMLAPSLDFDGSTQAFHAFTHLDNSHPKSQERPFSTPTFGSGRSALSSKGLNEMEKFWQPLPATQPKTNEEIFNQASAQITIQEPIKPNTDATFQIHGAFIVCQVKSGMLLIHQQRAYERIFFERYQSALDKQPFGSQQLIFQQVVELSKPDMALLIENKDEIHKLGLEFDALGTDSIVVRGVPIDMQQVSEKALIEGLVEQIKYQTHVLKVSKREALARAMAKRAVPKYGMPLTDTERKSLVDQLFACENPEHAPGGEKIITLLKLNELENFFS